MRIKLLQIAETILTQLGERLNLSATRSVCLTVVRKIHGNLASSFKASLSPCGLFESESRETPKRSGQF